VDSVLDTFHLTSNLKPSVHMHGCDKVTLVWGSLRFAPTNIRWNQK